MKETKRRVGLMRESENFIQMILINTNGKKKRNSAMRE
jgi:hypothetical protein